MIGALVLLTICLSGCDSPVQTDGKNSSSGDESAVSATKSGADYTADTKIQEVISDPVFGDYGRLIFPVESAYYSGNTLGSLRLTWYNNMDPNKTVEIANYMKARAEAGETIFYDIYTDEEKAKDPAKADTGLFFFKGRAGAKFAVCNAGGGFAYVGAMQDSFPHALELSKKGYNAFALIYRPGAQTACEDMARAIGFIFEHAGTAYFGGGNYPRPAAAVIQYTGHSEYTKDDPPTYMCVGENDGIANWRVMQRRAEAMQSVGVEIEFHKYAGLSHGFGLGTGTAAEGWLDDAVRFWERQM